MTKTTTTFELAEQLLATLNISVKAIDASPKLVYVTLAIGQDMDKVCVRLDRVKVPATQAAGVRRLLIWATDLAKWAEGRTRTTSPERLAASGNLFYKCCGRNTQLNHKPGCALARVSA